MTESRPDTDDERRQSGVEQAAARGEDERGGEAARPGTGAAVSAAGGGRSVTAAEDGVAAGSESRSPADRCPSRRGLDSAGSATPLAMTSSDFTSGSPALFSSLSRHCFPSSSICFTNKNKLLQY